MKHILSILVLTLVGSAFADDRDPSIGCMDSLLVQPEFGPLVARLALDPNQPPAFSMLTDEGKLSQKEAKLLAGYVEARASCVKLGAEFRQTHYPPEVVSLTVAAEGKANQIMADLYTKKINVSEANKEAQALRNDTRERVTAVVTRLKSEQAATQQQASSLKAQEEAQQRELEARRDEQQRALEAQRDAAAQQAEMARRQAALQYLQSHPPLAPAPYQVPTRPAPVNTTCFQAGNAVNCTAQ